MNAVKNNELEKLFKKKGKEKTFLPHKPLDCVKDIFHHSDQQFLQLAVPFGIPKSLYFSKRRQLTRMDAQLAPDGEWVCWTIAYLAGTMCTAVDLQIKLSLSFQLLRETVYDSKSFLIFVETKSTCSFSTVLFVCVQGPVLQRRIALLFTCCLFCLC